MRNSRVAGREPVTPGLALVRGGDRLTRTSTGGDLVQWLDAGRQTYTAVADEEVLRQPLHEASPIRTGVQYANRQNRHGWYAWTDSRRLVWFESAVEMESLVAWDQRGDVAAIAAQPFRLLFRDGSPCQSHVPDYFAVLRDGTQVLYDVKPLSRMTPSVEEQFAETARVCASVGWRHEVVHETSPARRANLSLLREFRHRRCHPADPGPGPAGQAAPASAVASVGRVGSAGSAGRVTVERVVDVFAGGRRIEDGRRMLSLRDPALAMPAIAHLLWHRFLDMGWETPLTLDTVVTSTGRGTPCCPPA